MAKNADAKRLKILEAAKKRFAHYGLAKTTMAEIAQDLSFSKALLYYYFPDKNNLFAAVMELTIDELLEESARKIEETNNVLEAINAFLETRLRVIKENYNVFEFTYTIRTDMPADLECVAPAMFEREILQVEMILEKGMSTGELKPIEDVMLTAKILLISMLGMRLGILKEFKNLFFPPTKEEYDYILDLQRKLSKIFIDGLRK